MAAFRVAALPMLMLLAPLRETWPQQAQPLQFSVNVDLVVMHATVRDQKGAFAADLRQQDFEVYEDGVRQSIRVFRHEDAPVTVGLIIDHSGSMRQKLAEVIAAARAFVQASSPLDELFAVNFNDGVAVSQPGAIQGSDSADELARAIASTPAQGMTSLYDAVFAARQRLQTAHQDKKALIVISDGGDNASHHTLDQVLKMAEQSSAVLYSIGIFDAADEDRNPDVLRRLAKSTGGEAFFPEKLEEIVAICGRIARDIRNQYTIGYVSNSTAPPGVYRKIRVTAAAAGNGKLQVYARAGYVSAPKLVAK